MLLRINNLKEKQKGFTFVEFLVYTFLLSGILLAMGGITVNVLSSSSNSEIVEEVTYNVRFAMQKIGAEIRDADTIVLPGREGDMLWLRTNDERDPILFWLEDGAIIMKVADYPKEKITASSTVIDSLTFRNVGLPKDPGSVQIQINASYYNPQNHPQYDFSDYFVSAYTLRAKNSKPSDKLLTDGLVGHWTFNEGKGLTAYDFSGNDNNGTLVGPPDWSENRFFEGDRALQFDGVGDYVNTPLNGFPDPMSDITIGFWTSPSGVLENGSILTTVPDESTNRINIHFPWENGNLYWDFGNVSYDSGRLITSWNPAWNNIWAHWVFISESGVGQKIYRNNVLLASDTNTASFSKGTKSLNIAKYAPNNVFWKGLIDDVRIYNRALSPSEVKLLYENTKPY